MPLKARIQNFQSIKDQTIVLDGLTVITGPNNSGKTAVMRAIQGVFNNPPAGSLVRHGATHLTVTLEFDDGNTIIWEKGDKINRYTLNGKVLDLVGRGCPPEVLSLGVSDIKIGSDKICPNIAPQFGGVLFLVDKSGSVVAEALSDVERVGWLNNALRASESDKKATRSEIKVRCGDLASAKQDIHRYIELDATLDRVNALQSYHEDAVKTSNHLEWVRGIRHAIEDVMGAIRRMAWLDGVNPPDVSEIDSTQKELLFIAKIRRSILDARVMCDRLQTWLELIPEHMDVGDITQLCDDLRFVSEVGSAIRQARRQIQSLQAFPDIEGFTSTSKLDKAISLAQFIRGQLTDRNRLRAEISSTDSNILRLEVEINELEEEIRTLKHESPTNSPCVVCGRV
jgi:energy-coupling factor transporter ATP-binding protein EcfA2